MEMSFLLPFFCLGDGIVSIVVLYCLVKNPGGWWFWISSVTVPYQFRAGSGFWTITGCLAVPGWHS